MGLFSGSWNKVDAIDDATGKLEEARKAGDRRAVRRAQDELKQVRRTATEEERRRGEEETRMRHASNERVRKSGWF